MPPKVISGGDNPYDIHDAKLSSSATAHESSSVTAHEISNTIVNYLKLLTKNSCLSIEFSFSFFKFFCKEFFMNRSPICKTSVSFPFLVSVFL